MPLLGTFGAASVRGLRGAAAPLVLTRIAASSIGGTFTYGAGGAAEANLNDNNDATMAADGSGLSSGTRAAYDFGSAVAIRRIRVITAPSNGFGNEITFDIRYSDTDLTSGFSTVTGAVTQIVVPAGLSQEAIANIDANGSHRYWAIEYALGTTGGNAWLGGVDMSHYV